MENQIKRLIDNVKIISIIPSGRSGSYFIQSLLDNHENILNIPFFVDLPGIYNEFKKNIEKGLNENEIVEDICKNSLIKNMLDTNIYDEKLGYGLKVMINRKPQGIIVNGEKFAKNLKKILLIINKIEKTDKKSFYLALHIAWAKTIGKDIKKAKYMIDSSHFYWKMKDLYDLDHETKFIITVRDPRASYYSYLKHNQFYSGKANKFLPEQINNTFNHTFYSLAEIDNFQKDWLNKKNCLIVKLEDIHNNFEKNISEIAKWLDIPFKKSLFNSTMAGYPWVAESFTHKRNILGQDKNSTSPKWKEGLSSIQIKNIEFLSAKYMDDLGYGRIYWINKKGILIRTLSFLTEQINQTDFSNFNIQNTKNLIAGRLKVLKYIFLYHPYKIKN